MMFSEIKLKMRDVFAKNAGQKAKCGMVDTYALINECAEYNTSVMHGKAVASLTDKYIC